ncbi:9331_t:CDS:2 [Paraglomus brasilianum]|uniref:9331_t:CDS:1 n=1 Tax=Paraglomus brasilianum TaxID=144538 RepID=A0A9N9FYW6_9GLOM|nr:9331_t:CDS:2 [Paraglomus brasilianum]
MTSTLIELISPPVFSISKANTFAEGQSMTVKDDEKRRCEKVPFV